MGEIPLKSDWIPSLSESGDSSLETFGMKLIKDTFFISDDGWDNDYEGFQPQLWLSYSTGDIANKLLERYNNPKQSGLGSLFGPEPTSEEKYGIIPQSAILELAIATKELWETNELSYQPPFQAMNANPKYMREILNIKLRSENLVSTFFCTNCHRFSTLHKAADPEQKVDLRSALYVLSPVSNVFNPEYYGCSSCFRDEAGLKRNGFEGLGSLFS